MRVWLLALLLLAGCAQEASTEPTQEPTPQTRTTFQANPVAEPEHPGFGPENSEWVLDAGELSEWVQDIDDRRACEMEVPDLPMELVRRFLDTEGATEAEIMAVVPTVPLKKMGLDDKGYMEMNQMVLIFMRSQPDVPDEEVRGIEHCIALAGGPHEHE